MTTSLNSTTPARDASYQLLHYLRKAINVASVPTGTVVTVGVLPAGAIVVAGLSGIYASADFTGTTNVIDIGYAADSLSTSDANAYASALAIPLTTGGFVAVDELATATGRARTVDTTITATWTGTATTGSLDVVVVYAPNR